jgi:hypothetical protein
MIVPRFNLGRSGLSLLLEGEIDQRKHNHRSNDHDGGVQQHKERSDHQATKHFPRVNLPEKVHGVAKRRPPSRHKRNGKPYKELVKIAHPPIIRRAARRCAGWSEGFCTQPLRRYRCHGEVRHELYRRALLGFAASGVPGLRRSALLLLAALVKPKSPHQTGKQKI